METTVPIPTSAATPTSSLSLSLFSSNTNRTSLQLPFNSKPPPSIITQQQQPPPNNPKLKFAFQLQNDAVSGKSRTTLLGGAELDVSSFVNVIESLGDANAVQEGFKVHAILVKNGYFDASLYIKVCLVRMYFRCGKVELARRVFDESSERDVSLWGAMVAGFAHHGMRIEALQYVRLMVDEGIMPNSALMMGVLPLVGELGALRIGQEAHAYLVKKKFYYEQVRIRTALVDMYSKCGDVGSGRRVLSSLVERGISCWSALIAGSVSSGGFQKAVKSMVRMQREGFRPSHVSVASILSVCAQSRALKRGKEIHAYALKHWFLPHVSIASSLMVLYSKCGLIEYCRNLFDGMERRNVILWTAMFDAYVENGCFPEAFGVLRSMQLTEYRPDTVTMARMLSLCSKLKLVKLVLDKGSMTWTALIRAYVYKEFYKDAIDLFDDMISKGCAPNRFTFEAVLSVCDKAGFVEEAIRIFNLLSRYKVEASKEHCVSMIQLLTRYGKLDEAQIFVEMSSLL
ncbi:pentatricopeptide repeat-containing protein At1g71460, chloroplastic isoform X1 [Arachis hypogaea]|uniref:pentatricopeptide repeat-containing protein At1g71460, chloroplastic isoform X1 n=1 Tax=Arachis hypogaea TaxID=3818 RepID=UPI0011056FA7|nr:pentatricopeptide repeat-containing protein At1g71460, chloroplastic isoform X1 [Arachis hypogaea]